MDQQIEQYLNNLVNDCLQAPAFANLDEQQKQTLRQNLDDYFSQVVLETLVYSLTDEQAIELEKVDLQTPEGAEKLQFLAASVPGFFLILQDILQKEVEQIKQTGQIPQ